jgi:hypothetical protein
MIFVWLQHIRYYQWHWMIFLCLQTSVSNTRQLSLTLWWAFIVQVYQTLAHVSIHLKFSCYILDNIYYKRAICYLINSVDWQVHVLLLKFH